eukprot:TRINITY_DN4087_c0_g1_i1.p1 TRINITY_DN4087_c0_g1~~TRINITY_DN4087_c0_g1_i1.p1  ORF type:complete len:645 (+),score=101.48 TRINITY_DN4087_c0_g1_i1:389-2323(+)
MTDQPTCVTPIGGRRAIIGSHDAGDTRPTPPGLPHRVGEVASKSANVPASANSSPAVGPVVMANYRRAPGALSPPGNRTTPPAPARPSGAAPPPRPAGRAPMPNAAAPLSPRSQRPTSPSVPSSPPATILSPARRRPLTSDADDFVSPRLQSATSPPPTPRGADQSRAQGSWDGVDLDYDAPLPAPPPPDTRQTITPPQPLPPPCNSTSGAMSPPIPPRLVQRSPGSSEQTESEAEGGGSGGGPPPPRPNGPPPRPKAKAPAPIQPRQPSPSSPTSTMTTLEASISLAIKSPTGPPSAPAFGGPKVQKRLQKKVVKDIKKRRKKGLLPYDSLVDLLMREDLELIRALCTTCPQTEVDRVSKALVHLFVDEEQILPLISACIKHEVTNTTMEGTLFRANSLPSKLMSSYAGLVGRPFLRHCLRGLITTVSKNPNPACWEVDPLKADASTTVRDNAENLAAMTKMFLMRISSTMKDLPPSLRYICHELHRIVTPKFPTAKHSVIGGFIFLRFVCPAIISPEGFGIVTDTVPDGARRCLVLTSKILQNLSNGVQFGKKEEYMVVMNGFLQEHDRVVKDYFERLASDGTPPPESPPELEGIEVEEAHMKTLQNILSAQLEKVVKGLEETGAVMSGEELRRVMRDLPSP